MSELELRGVMAPLGLAFRLRDIPANVRLLSHSHPADGRSDVDDSVVEVNRAKLNERWRGSREFKRAFLVRVGLIAVGVALSILAMLAVLNENFDPYRFLGSSSWTTGIGMPVGISLAYFFFASWLDGRLRGHLWETVSDHFVIELAAELASNRSSIDANLNGKLDLIEVWQYNQKQLELYLATASKQAELSFTRAQNTSMVGFGAVLLSAGIVIWGNGSVALPVSIIGAAATALSGFISMTFLQTHRRSVEHMQQAYRHPISMMGLLNLERIADLYITGERREHAFEQIAMGLAAGKVMEETWAPPAVEATEGRPGYGATGLSDQEAAGPSAAAPHGGAE